MRLLRVSIIGNVVLTMKILGRMEGVYVSLEFHHGGKFVNDPNPSPVVAEGNVPPTIGSVEVENVNANDNNVEFHEEEVQYEGVEANVDLNAASLLGLKIILVQIKLVGSMKNIILVQMQLFEVENDDNVLDKANISEEEDNLAGDFDSEDSIYEGLDANLVEGSDEDKELRVAREKVKQYKRKKSQGIKKGDVPKVHLGPAEDDAAYEGNDRYVGTNGIRVGGTEEHLESDDPDSRGGSEVDNEGNEVDGREKRKKSKKFYYDPNCDVPQWELGLIFENVQQFRHAARKYGVYKGVHLLMRSNENHRVRVK
ncbi:hypothetical protein GH714_017051 [Hevea brasiliensis]|uniref:Transposase MuDR plant domain-containing protein n=1 Tax=Hevea brasiliensis TaxID=3981 RepID=A0A6A6LY21_HEVBR|nr:hypothetical protein GH714_017051 [Hevea brasiliensis]